MRAIASLAVGLLLLLPASGCSFEGFCLNCAEGDAGDGDGDGDGDRDGGTFDAGGDGGPCIPNGVEICDGVDNDCNGQVDDNIPEVGQTCSTNVGECVEGVRQCEAGELVCAGGVEPVAEACDLLDNDCDNQTDEGDPGGGMACGTDVGECVAGVTQCIGGNVDCVGDVGMTMETCDGRDNDCDNMFDEGTGGGQCGPVTDEGLCEYGTEMCIGGQLQCQGAVMPDTEVCDAMDHDCDGDNLNGFNLDTDVLNCGQCGHNCYMDPAPMGQNTSIRQCVMGSCEVGLCAQDFHDVNNDYADGCEYGPCVFQGSQESCNGVDDDCDGMIDENLGMPPAICLQQGECNGTVATCDGTNGWVCNYGPTVSTDVDGNIVPETQCDGLDNDCDGADDEAYPLLGTGCDDGLIGACRGTGEFVCNMAGDGVDCMITDPGDPMGTETCDNTDEDCDGTVDEGDHQLWVDIGGGVEMFAFEASRPDSNSSTAGLVTTLPCSKANALPWTNITHPQAEAACAAIGARLCTETEWESTCEAGSSCDWSYNNNCTTFQPTTCNGNEYDTDTGTPGDQDEAIPVGTLTQCFADLVAGDVFDMSGNVKEWAAERAPDVNPIRGGSYNNNQVGISCEHDFLVADDSFFFPNIGFRCCR